VCAYRVYQSSSLQNFIENYSDLLTPDSLFGSPLYLVVQNKSMGEWLKLKLAEKRGVSADNPYVLPEKALRELSDGYSCVRSILGSGDSVRPLLYMDNLKIRLFKILEEMFTGTSPIPPSCRDLYDYVTGFDPQNNKSRLQIRSNRLYELSDSIAGLFSHYGMNSLPLVESWEIGSGYPGVPGRLKKHEKWQRYLWKMVYDAGVSFSRILQTVEKSSDTYDGPAGRVVLFGSSFLGDTGIKFFYRLSQDLDVDHFILTPSRAYENYPPDVRNPLLESWCTQMDGFAELADSFELKDRNHFYPVRGDTSLLSQIQRDILENSGSPKEPPAMPFPDDSISIHGFTSPWREVEVLKDLILDALNRDPELSLTDIALLAPDINKYAPFIEALFPSERPGLNLPFNLIDLNSSEMSPLIQGFLHLFSLPGGEFSRKDLFVLFDNPCFRESLGIGRHERDSWLQLCDVLNIKWGYSRDHKSAFFQDTSDFNSWMRGFERIYEGLFFEEEDKPDFLPFEAPDDESARSWGILTRTLENLYNDLFELDKVSMPLEQWVLLAESFLEVYIKPRHGNRDDEQDRIRLKGCFRDLLNLADETPLPGSRSFDFFIFRTLLTEFVRKSSGVKGRYLTQGITCSSLKPMRAIPFRRIYLLGMNEADFPGEDDVLSFDLKETTPQTIDLSRSGGDRYSFLETLLSASEKLTLFYKNRDPLRGEVLQPSIVISELLDYINRRFLFSEGTSAESLLITEESIHNFDPRYFDGTREYRSFNHSALRSASLLFSSVAENPAPHRLSRISSSREEEEEISMPVDELLSFLKNPGVWYFRKVLKISAEDEDSREQDSRENRELEYLDRFGYLEERLKNPAGLGDSTILDQYLREQQIRGNLPESDILFLEKERLSQRLIDMAHQSEARDLKEEGFFDLLIDPERQSSWRRGRVFLPQQSVPVFRRNVDLGGGCRGDVYLCGILESLHRSENRGRWMNLEFCDAGTPVLRHSLRGALYFMILSGLQGDLEELELIRIGKREYPRLIFSGSGERELNRVLLDNPSGRLDRILSLCLSAEGETVPLYPVLGEALAGELLERPLMTDGELKDQWFRQWLKEASNTTGMQTFHRCRYRLEFMKNPPEADPARLREMLELIYIPLLSAVKKGGRRG